MLPPPTFDRPPRTIRDLIAASVRAFGRAPAILAPGRDSLTYEGLGRQLASTACALAETGYGCRSRIAIGLPQGVECAVAVLAVCTHAICAPLNPELDEATLAQLLVAMRIDALIVPEGEDSPIARAARRASVALIRLRFDAGEPAGTFALVPEGRRQPVALTAPQIDDVTLLTGALGVAVPLKALFAQPTAASIAGAVRAARAGATRTMESIVPITRRSRTPRGERTDTRRTRDG